VTAGHYNVDKNHYMVTMQKQNIPLLNTYVPFNVTLLENHAVSPGGKRMYLVQNASVRLFPNFDTMVAFNFTMKDVLFIGNWSEFSSMPEGPRLLAVSDPPVKAAPKFIK
jgi:hypothetical protein